MFAPNLIHCLFYKKYLNTGISVEKHLGRIPEYRNPKAWNMNLKDGEGEVGFQRDENTRKIKKYYIL